MLDQAHRREGAAIEVTANRRTVLIDGAALFAEVDAGAIRTLLQHQLAIAVPPGEQMRQLFAIALLVHNDARVIAAGCARAARDRPRLAAPPGRQEVLWCAV